MDTLQDSWSAEGRRAVKPMKVLVVGAGIGGLSAGLALGLTGHSVTILESVPKIQEVGAGIQLAPNASRILHRLGVLKEAMLHATVLDRVSIRRYDSDEEIGSSPMMPSVGLRYGAPTSVIHRADLQRILLNAAKRNGCEILTGHQVVEIDPNYTARVKVCKTETGELTWLSGDLIIGADGIKSFTRQEITKSVGYMDDNPINTGDAAYRFMIPRERVLHEPELLEMMDQNVVMRYMGPHGHVMAYPIRNNTAYNMVLIHPSSPSSSTTELSWTSKGDRDSMLRFYDSWSPAIRKWLTCADENIYEWNLCIHPEIPTWIKGSVALIGDACHPMLPYVAQGAANAIEDAAVLAMAFTCTADIRVALNLYELIRKHRGEVIAASASETARTLHLVDGPEQRQRDEAIMNASLGMSQHPDKWNNSAWQDYMWGVDVMKETIDKWAELLQKTRSRKRALSGSRRFSLPSALPPQAVMAFDRSMLENPPVKATSPLQTWELNTWRSKPIKQNPVYHDEEQLRSVVSKLSQVPALVHPKEVMSLRSQLKDVAEGRAFLLQGGDCAELFDYCREDVIQSKMKLLHQMGLILNWGTNKRVVRIGRIAGQYAKPRSSPVETISGQEVPSFRGDILNGSPINQRNIDPDRLLQAYFHSSATVNSIRTAVSTGIFDLDEGLDWSMDHVRNPELKMKYTAIAKDVERTLEFLKMSSNNSNSNHTSNFYTSHEGLVLEYEQALTQRVENKSADHQTISSEHAKSPTSSSEFYDTSGHFIWIGDRTRQLDHAHVEFFRGVANPIGVKVGPTTSVSDILALLRTLNPSCEPGKITLITRFGADKVQSLLPQFIRAVEDSEYHRCVVWQCDPMHGNTVSTPYGIKTRHFSSIYREFQETLQVHLDQGGYLGGMHLEMTSEAVTECLGGGEELQMEDLQRNYTTACDPRLNRLQSLELALLVAESFSRAVRV